ncbi:Branched-chain amino acid transport ATP-binding protein LivG (TC 3.A.1.4.1) [Halanaerobium saccharolyticum subsp. saccharolyticum DSM 6643]|uniref:Branched-chain amino acid transport ATP-binding protein LivG (TC 3.A.1.4.1) n=1 Tax=Halanaerobium saccharolyticum subsp. saccharolyticum DSM 6643 TaxID=1293054 RepID=M5E0M5_9FIRM|nr:ABC transporter ATP-binding protein [Halanaerobium saccharolyticum]CCU79119.1 Branched-chain amino acid transport ATP-binding protein LivG (TC 3.A.1.4.1) [Halanaerobium saccharolyticum subsp. saccharolyticum DSM 6643]
MSKQLLKLDKLTKKFGGLTAVENFSMTLEEGELLGLIGPNGAGKTTTFNLISGNLAVTSGNIVYKDDDITDLRPDQIADIGIARTFQNIRLMTGMTVLENMQLAFHIWNDYNILDTIFRTNRFLGKEDQYLKEIDETLKHFNISQYKDEKVDDLPPGIQRKADIARAILLKPNLILLDEPTAGMNPSETDELVNIIKWINKDLNISTILVEHDMRVIMNICPRIIVMEQGDIIAEGNPEHVQSNQKVIEAYLGKSYQI